MQYSSSTARTAATIFLDMSIASVRDTHHLCGCTAGWAAEAVQQQYNCIAAGSQHIEVQEPSLRHSPVLQVITYRTNNSAVGCFICWIDWLKCAKMLGSCSCSSCAAKTAILRCLICGYMVTIKTQVCSNLHAVHCICILAQHSLRQCAAASTATAATVCHTRRGPSAAGLSCHSLPRHDERHTASLHGSCFNSVSESL
jgi:hypothetical protein